MAMVVCVLFSCPCKGSLLSWNNKCYRWNCYTEAQGPASSFSISETRAIKRGKFVIKGTNFCSK